MILTAVRVVNLLFAGLNAGILYCHFLEMAGKMQFSGPAYMQVQDLLYRGWAVWAGICEIGALLTTAILLILTRRSRLAFTPASFHPFTV